MKRFAAYHFAALAVYAGGLLLTESLPVKPLERFATTYPVAYVCWGVGVLFSTFYAAGWLSFYRRNCSLVATAFISVFTAFVSTLFTLVAFLAAAQWNLISIN